MRPETGEETTTDEVIDIICFICRTYWAEAMDKWTYRAGIEAAYRRSALELISASRTISTDVALVIVGMMPLMLLLSSLHNITL